MECLQRGNLQIDGKASDAIENIVLTDNAEPPFWHEGLRDDARITTTFGDISDEPYVKSVFDKNYDVIFHLASIVSGHGEQDFDLAMKVNVDGARYLFEAIRAQNNNAKVVFASSIAAFGGDSMPEQLSDFSKQTPLTTYGVTKVIGELLINDYSRKGFFDGRSARLPTVIVRPGFGTDRAVGLPAFNTNVQELMDALKNAAGNRHLGEHVMEKDDQIVAICSGWPKKVDTTRAQSLGLPMDDSIEQIVLDYVEDYLDA